MDINVMTRKQFEELDCFKGTEEFDVDSIVLLPTKRHDQSGYNVFFVVACNRDKPVGICYGYDTFSIIMESEWNRVGIDCLRGSGLMRIFLPPNEYVIKPYLHQIEKKEKYEWNSRFDEAIKDNQTGDIVNAVEVLNKQYKRIKELEEENRYLEKIYKELIIDRRDLCLERNDIFEENQQLKQSQKQLAIEKLEKMREKFGYRYNSQLVISSKYLSDFIDNQIKELKGE